MVFSHRLGAVVLPAQNGVLSALGYDLAKLGSKSLGVIVQEGSRKASGVVFPDLGIFYTLKNEEIADIEFLSHEKTEFKIFFDQQKQSTSVNIAWILGEVVRFLKPKFFLTFEKAEEVLELFQSDLGLLREFFSGDPQTPVLYLGLGIEEFKTETLIKIQEISKDRLLFYRVLPAGLHKVELALYFRHP